jgi:hypothetical protein
LHPSANKLLWTVFWDSKGPILEHYMDRGITILSVNYCNLLGNELMPAIHTKQRGRLSLDVPFHDRVHLTFSDIQQLIWEVLEHPSHSPDLALSNFHLFDLSGML